MAVTFLEENGYRIVERNARHRIGELDIIAEDPDGELVFAEVKTRSSRGFGYPEEAVDRRKLAKLEAVVLTWLRANRHEHTPWRLDVIAVELEHDPPKITHLKDVGAP